MKQDNQQDILDCEIAAGRPEVLRIDLDQVLRSRLPRHYKFIPRFVISWLERVIRQRPMNAMLEECRGLRDAAFCRGVLQHLGITVHVKGAEKLPPATHRRVTIVSNHPLGGLDGMALIDWATQYWGEGVKFVVNDLLMAIEPLSGTFIPINKFGHQSRDASSQLDAAMQDDNPVIIFPAGLVSRKGSDGKICDLKWNKMFVTKSAKYHRDIIPLHFNGQNSSFFYKFARLRTKLHIKLNIEMVRLPAEVFNSRGSEYTISIGDPIKWETLQGGANAADRALAIKKIVYDLQPMPATEH